MDERPLGDARSRMKLPLAALATTAVALLGGASAAHADGPGVGQTAPLYPGNTLQISVPEPVVAGVPTQVNFTGTANWGEATSATTTSYSLYMYVMDSSVTDVCEASYSSQLQKSINLPGLNGSMSVTGFVVSDINLGAEPPSPTRDYTIASTPFVVKPGLSKVSLCAYQRFITDDVAVYALDVPVAQPNCKPATSSVRRGGQLGLKCNVSGVAQLKFSRSGGGGKTVTTNLSTKDGSGAVSTKGLKAGRYSVSASSKGVSLGRFSVTVK
jgi:hypothetical protein